MAKFNNYFFGIRGNGNNITRLVDYRAHGDEEYSLSGKCYERDGFPDGSELITSTISKICGNVYTHSGSVYELENMHPDYESFILAINEAIPVLHDWDISGNLDTGYTFYALDQTDQSIVGKILKQEGNFLYLNINGDEEKFFIDWISIDYEDMTQLRFCGNISNSDITLRRMESFCNEKCRPILFPKE